MSVENKMIHSVRAERLLEAEGDWEAEKSGKLADS